MRRRRGFTLVEVMISVVLLSIIGLGITRLLQSQMRFFQRATGARDARSVTRNALNLMRNEMRMIEPRGISSATTTSITVRVPYAVGVYCAAGTATFLPVDSLTWATAVNGGYAYRDTALNATYTYVASSSAPSTALATDCTTTASITPVTGGMNLGTTPTLPVLLASGSPVLLYQTITYRLSSSMIVPGRIALWRIVTGGASEEIAVPFDGASVFQFYVSGGITSQTAVPGTVTDISGLELVLIGESERSSPGTNVPESAETRVSIFFRNAVN